MRHGTEHYETRGTKHYEAHGTEHYETQRTEHYEAHMTEHYETQVTEHYETHSTEHFESQSTGHYVSHGTEHYELHGTEHYETHGTQHYETHGTEHFETHITEHFDTHGTNSKPMPVPLAPQSMKTTKFIPFPSKNELTRVRTFLLANASPVALLRKVITAAANSRHQHFIVQSAKVQLEQQCDVRARPCTVTHSRNVFGTVYKAPLSWPL
jgi:hypothetical protein